MKRCASCATVYSGEACPRCVAELVQKTTVATPSVEEITLDPGSYFHGLHIDRVLGRGGMGVVYLARQPALDRPVALKLLPRKLALDPDFQGRFTREARALASLSHPNIVTIHDFGAENGVFFLVMEYVDGVTLRSLMQSARLPAADALRIVPQLCDALEYAHAEGVVHRDIKPENIMLDKKGRVKIADFGLAKLVGEETRGPMLTQTNVVMGTPHYMAPEQFENPKSVDHRADIYSLGVVFYEMLTGELPLGRFEVPSKKIQLDVRLDEVVLRSLEKAPDKRYQRASHVKDDISRVTTVVNRESQVPTIVTPIPAKKPVPVAIYVFVGCLATLFIGFTAVMFLFVLRRPAPRNPQPKREPRPVAVDAPERKPKLEDVYFLHSERPGSHRWIEPEKLGLPRNPFAAKSPEEIDALAQRMDKLGLHNISRADVREGYTAVWWGIQLTAMDTPAAERIEREILAPNNQWSSKWVWRKGEFLVFATGGEREDRLAFSELVLLAKRKLKLPEEQPELPLENMQFDRSDLTSEWAFARKFAGLSLPMVAKSDAEKTQLLSGLQSFAPVAAADVESAYCAAFQKEGSPAGMYAVGIEFRSAGKALDYHKTVSGIKGWQGARRTEALVAGRVVALFFLHSTDIGMAEKLLRSLRMRMGYRRYSIEALLPEMGELPEGHEFGPLESDPKKITEELGLDDLIAGELVRARRRQVLPTGTIVVLQVQDYTVRNKVIEELRKRGHTDYFEESIAFVEGPDELTQAMKKRWKAEP